MPERRLLEAGPNADEDLGDLDRRPRDGVRGEAAIGQERVDLGDLRPQRLDRGRRGRFLRAHAQTPGRQIRRDRVASRAGDRDRLARPFDVLEAVHGDRCRERKRHAQRDRDHSRPRKLRATPPSPVEIHARKLMTAGKRGPNTHPAPNRETRPQSASPVVRRGYQERDERSTPAAKRWFLPGFALVRSGRGPTSDRVSGA